MAKKVLGSLVEEFENGCLTKLNGHVSLIPVQFQEDSTPPIL